MADDRTWIAQIAAGPDDDRPRLVYADHLMERGDPRGELIAVQCALAHHEATDEPADLHRLVRRERKLLDDHLVTWIAGARAILRRHMTFRRGFVEHANLDDPQELASLMPRLQPITPLLRAVDIQQNLGALAAANLATIDEVVVHGVPDHAAMTALAGAHGRSRLRRLRLAVDGVGDPALVALVELPFALHELAFGLDRRPAQRLPILGRLAATPARAELDVLRVRKPAVLDELAAILPALPRLHTLQIAGGAPTGTSVLALATAAPALTSLDLDDRDGVEAVDVDLEALLASTALRRLRLANLALGDRHALALARSPHAARLTRLDLRGNEIGDAGATALVESEHLQHLQRLNLNVNSISDHTKTVLRASPLAKHAQLQLR